MGVHVRSSGHFESSRVLQFSLERDRGCGRRPSPTTKRPSSATPATDLGVAIWVLREGSETRGSRQSDDLGAFEVEALRGYRDLQLERWIVSKTGNRAERRVGNQTVHGRRRGQARPQEPRLLRDTCRRQNEVDHVKKSKRKSRFCFKKREKGEKIRQQSGCGAVQNRRLPGREARVRKGAKRHTRPVQRESGFRCASRRVPARALAR